MSSDAWATEQWLDEATAESIAYGDYWNDVEAERGKEWWVLDGDFPRLERYLDESGLKADLAACADAAEAWTGAPLAGTGLDLAAGAFWSAPELLRRPGVERLYGLDYSRHRILELAPALVAHYGVTPAQIVLVWGSFYELHLADGAIDFVVLSQALHHADDPAALLAETRRVLRPGGVVLVIGEHRIRWRGYAAWLRRVLTPGSGTRATTSPTGADIYGVDAVIGDHFYTRREYGQLFADAGFEHRRVTGRRASAESYVLRLP